MTTLLTILAYGVTVGIAGVLLALRERQRRRAFAGAEEQLLSRLSKSLHGRLKTDSGEEMEVFLQKAGQ